MLLHRSLVYLHWFITMEDRKSPFSRVVVPLPNWLYINGF